jgi:hypothetical protein
LGLLLEMFILNGGNFVQSHLRHIFDKFAKTFCIMQDVLNSAKWWTCLHDVQGTQIWTYRTYGGLL